MVKVKHIGSRAASVALRIVRRVLCAIGLYLDDLLMAAGSVCFTAAAAELAGRPAALIVGGACLVAYAVVIARARRGGGR